MANCMQWISNLLLLGFFITFVIFSIAAGTDYVGEFPEFFDIIFQSAELEYVFSSFIMLTYKP